jgi:APA family basic amino acid/polyamine antiporter
VPNTFLLDASRRRIRTTADGAEVGTAPPAPRPLGFWSATALVVGHTIGVGIFLTPAELIGALASPALTFGLWLVCGLLVLAGAFTFGELASRYPRAGGTYVYLREAWGPRVAFLYGWQSILIMDPGVTAALALGLAPYLVVLWPTAAGAERWLAVATVWALALVNMAGLKLSARVLNVLTAVKVLALAAIVIGAFTGGAGSWSHFTPFAARRPGAPPLLEALGLGLIGAFYSFGGFWEASRVAGEMRDPRRQLPRALALGVAVVTTAYLLTTLAFLYLVPAELATSAPEFARRAGDALFGPSGAPTLAAVVTVSVVASVMALLLMAPRLYLAMSDDRLFPAALSALHPTTKAPARATALLASIASVFVLSGTFPQVVAFFMCTTLVFIALAAAGLVAVRRRQPETDGFRSPGYPLTLAAFVLFVCVVIALIALARPVPALAGFALVLLGVPAYRILLRRGALGTNAADGGAR